MSLTHDAGSEAVQETKRDPQNARPPRFPAPKSELGLLSSIVLSSALDHLNITSTQLTFPLSRT
jgi:hypothetical protein